MKKINIEPRILIENKQMSNYNKTENSENMLIHGDNLLALKALEHNYSNKIKCIYIDSPYNTGSAFEHSVWYNLAHGHKSFEYIFIPSEEIKLNSNFNNLATRFRVK